MCSPTIIAATVTAATSAAKTVVDYNQERKNAKYNSQIAILNAKNEENEAKRQVQIGIEQARTEKISARQKANVLNAKNASNGFDVTFGNNALNYENINLEGENSALNIQNEYNNNAQNHLDRANSYYAQSKNSVTSYNSALFSKALGNTNKVSSKWYESSPKAGDAGIVLIDKGGYL